MYFNSYIVVRFIDLKEYKIKIIGIVIYGVIDGYLRKIFWLEVFNINNNFRVVVRYFINYICKLKGVFLVVCLDYGSENSIIKDI